MKVVLFCGGYGTRLREYSETVPKPLVPIGNMPIIWHLMKYYAHFGHKDFVMCLGYQGHMIKEFFLNYNDCLSNDFTYSQGGKKIDLRGRDIADWTIDFVDTGLKSNIGQRLLRVQEQLENEEVFLANYSDGLSNLPLDEHIEKFRESGAVAGFVGVRPSNTLSGTVIGDDGLVHSIQYLSEELFINGGFFILSNRIFDYIKEGDELVEQPFQRLIKEKKLFAYKYPGFWSAMDTFKDKKRFDEMHVRGERPWEVWSPSGR